jgi:hypothetical protein
VRSLIFLFALTVMTLARPAFAQVDPFEFEVYPYQTLGRGMIEIESSNSFVPKGIRKGTTALRAETSSAT